MTFQLPQLMPHQEMAKDFIISHPYCGIFLSIGGAKTLSTLAALAQIRPAGHILVIAPVAIARSTWIDEIEKWGIPLRTRSLLVDENDRPLSKAARLKRFDEVFTDPPTMYFINQELLVQPARPEILASLGPTPHDASDLIQQAIVDALNAHGPIPRADLAEAARDLAPPRANGKPATKKSINDALRAMRTADALLIGPHECSACRGRGCRECKSGLIDRLPIVRVADGTYANGRTRYRNVPQWPFDTVIIDESQNMKNPSSERFKALKRVRPAIKRLIELTGTPSPQSLLDLWSQMYLIDMGATLGTYTQYRGRFFNPTMHVDGRPVKWELRPGAAEEIHRLVAPYVISAENTNIPLPSFSIDTVNVTLPKDMMDQYRNFAYEQVLELASPDPDDSSTLIITADNAAVLHGKLIQYASGTIYTGDDGSHYTVVHTEKIDVLRHLVAQTNGNVLIGYRYRSEAREIIKALQADGINVERFDKSRAMVKRWNAKQIQAMVLHPASAGPGLNIQDGGSTLIWYTLPDSLEHYQQLNGRLIRIGQKDPVQIWQLVTKGTKDAHQPKALERKRLIQDGLIDAVRRDNIPHRMAIEDVLSNLDLGSLA